MTSEGLALLAGAAISIAAAYVPGFNGWFERKDPVEKRLIMAAFLLAIAIAIFGANCAGLPMGSYITLCSIAGAWDLFTIFLLALAANQGAFLITPKPTELRGFINKIRGKAGDPGDAAKAGAVKGEAGAIDAKAPIETHRASPEAVARMAAHKASGRPPSRDNREDFPFA